MIPQAARDQLQDLLQRCDEACAKYHEAKAHFVDAQEEYEIATNNLAAGAAMLLAITKEPTQ